MTDETVETAIDANVLAKLGIGTAASVAGSVT